jgi:hypothetical protein
MVFERKDLVSHSCLNILSSDILMSVAHLRVCFRVRPKSACSTLVGILLPCAAVCLLNCYYLDVEIF